MKLNTTLYRLLSLERSTDSVTARLRLLPDSIIYQAHFPGKPITPGVCITQMAVEIMEEALGKSLMMKKAKNVKFLAVITPDETVEVEYAISKIRQEGSSVEFLCVVKNENKLFAKLSLVCEEKKK